METRDQGILGISTRNALWLARCSHADVAISVIFERGPCSPVQGGPGTLRGPHAIRSKGPEMGSYGCVLCSWWVDLRGLGKVAIEAVVYHLSSKPG